MSYQLYRNTTLGHTLQESLDELIQVSKVSFYAEYRWKAMLEMRATKEEIGVWELVLISTKY
jgi:Transcription initiation factor IIA, gamma subunit, helical domain